MAIERAYGSYEELAADPDIDVAYIATPHVYHEAHTLLCLHSGKHVLCEKPFAINAAQADRMIECAHAQRPIPDGSAVDPISTCHQGGARTRRRRSPRAHFSS